MDIRKWFKKSDGEPVASKPTSKVESDDVKKYSSPALKRATHVKKEAPKKAEESSESRKRSSTRASRNKRRIIEDDDEDEDADEDVDMADIEEEKKWKKQIEAEEDEDEEDLAELEEERDEDEEEIPPGKRKRKSAQTESKGRGKGRGRGVTLKTEKGTSIGAPPVATKKAPSAGRGGWGGGAFMGERAPPPHKGEKEAPRGPEDALSGLTFVISGTLDSLEREEAEDLIKSHGGRITGSVSGKTSFLLADEDVGGRKSEKAKQLKVPFLTEDKLFDLIRSKIPKSGPKPPSAEVKGSNLPKKAAEQKTEAKDKVGKPAQVSGEASRKKQVTAPRGKEVLDMETWPQKYAPRTSEEIVGNQTLVKQLRDWLTAWHHNAQLASAPKGRKGSSAASGGFKKAVLISGTPGIGKTTTARVVSQELGFQILEVNASDTRGKADSKLTNGMAGKTANVIKEMVSNDCIALQGEGRRRPVLIMDEVDGMSGGDRGGVSDLIASIKASRVPILCICNDRYARQLQSLTAHCLLLNYRKPTKQQMAKRLRQIANQEKVQVADNVLEELSERVNGDMRMALNQLQYMAITSRQLSFSDLKARLQSSAKDEDLKPMAAVDRLLGFAYERLRFDDRLDAALSDIDLVPLMVQENYLNYRPNVGADPSGLAAMERVMRAAEAISEGDRVNVSIRRFQNWQLLPFSGVMSSVYPGALVHGQRVALAQGEMNFNRFPSWLGKNSTAGKNRRLLDDLHCHMLASRTSQPTRMDVRLDYLGILVEGLTAPLKNLPKDAGVAQVLALMETYSLTLEDYEAAMALLKLKGSPDPLQGIPPAVKGQLTREFKKQRHRVKSADLLPEIAGRGAGKKKIKARLAAAMEPSSMADADVPVAVDDVEKEEVEEEEEEEDDATPVPVKKAAAGKGASSSAVTPRGKGGAGRGRGRGKGKK